MNIIKTPEEVEKIRQSAQLLSQCLNMLVENAKPGVSGKHLDTLAEQFILGNGAVPAFKDYPGPPGAPKFPGSICFSRNHVIVHGIPTEEEIIEDGDILTIDCGLSLDGWFADAAKLLGIGNVSKETKIFIEETERTIQAGVDVCIPGKRLGDIGYAIQRVATFGPFHNVIEFCGHGIGREMHEAPQVYNFGKANKGLVLKPGMVFCLEPMLLEKKVGIGVMPDRWTIVSLDKTRATHIEYMVLVTEDGPDILLK